MSARRHGLLALVVLAGCPLFERQASDDDEREEAETDPGVYAEEVDAKLRRYSECRDTTASVMSESWERYSDQVGADGKPKRRREGVYLRGISSNSFRTCRRVIASATTGVAMPKIEATTVALIDAASRYAELTRELDDYGDAEGWKDDDWATLARVDPELRAAHQQWTEADRAVQQAIDLRHIENDQLLLGVLERRVGPLELASRRVMIHARPLVRCLENEGEVELDACRPLFEAFDAVEANFEEVYDGDPGADKVFWMSTFANDVAEFHEVAGELVRKLGQRKLRPAELQQLRDIYSSLVRDAETLDFDFP